MPSQKVREPRNASFLRVAHLFGEPEEPECQARHSRTPSVRLDIQTFDTVPALTVYRQAVGKLCNRTIFKRHHSNRLFPAPKLLPSRHAPCRFIPALFTDKVSAVLSHQCLGFLLAGFQFQRAIMDARRFRPILCPELYHLYSTNIN